MINCYPVAGKKKSEQICFAFAMGALGATGVPTNIIEGGKWRPGPSFFFGINDSNQEAWDKAQAHPQFDVYYADNAYFDRTRGTHFRITRNRLQHDGLGFSDCARFAALPGVFIYPWRSNPDGAIVIVPQSDDFMRRMVGYRGDWLADTVRQVREVTQRPLIVRPWSRDKDALSRTLQDDLNGAFALVTWASAAAVEAVLAGIPVVTGPFCAAHAYSHRVVDLGEPELIPLKPDDEARRIWAGVLADNQWTLDEMRDGTAWRDLNKGRYGEERVV